MNTFLFAGVVGAAVSTSLWGWGWAVRRCARTAARTAPLTIAIGMAAVLFIGGALNFARLVSPGALDAVGVIGLALAALGWLLSGRRGLSAPTRETVVLGIPLLAAGWFLAVNGLPPAAYNVHDDLEKYFSHPVRMLETGTLQPNPLSSMGAETLGGQAFLQAFAAAHFPLTYLGAVDGFYCRLLCIALAAYVIKPRPWAVGALSAELAVLSINPQLVNISSVFSGAVLVLATLMLAGVAGSPTDEHPAEAELGLLYAGALALKTTLCVFVGVHLLAIVALGAGPALRRLGWALRTAGWTAIFVAPWLLIHVALYLSHAAGPLPALPVEARQPLGLLSTEPLAYGATQIHYTAIALGGLLAAGLVVVGTLRGAPRRSPAGTALAAAGLTACAVYFTMVVGLGPLLFGELAATRYACPMLIASVPALIRLCEPLGEGRKARIIGWVAAGAGMIVTAAFLPSAISRAGQLAHERMELAFLGPQINSRAKAGYFGYNREVFSGSVEARLSKIQALVPPGDPLVAWVMTPFWLNFSRNPIFDADPAGLGMRWACWPPKAHFFLLEYKGYAVRSMDDYRAQLATAGLAERISIYRSLTFLREMSDRSSGSKVLYNDGSYVLMRLGGR